MGTPEQALIAQAGPHMLASRAKAIMATEVGKGCNAMILQQPVALEPPFTPIAVPKDLATKLKQPEFIYEQASIQEDLVRFQVWISPEYPFNWDCCELFLKHLLTVSHRIGLEFSGNQDRIIMSILCHKKDIPIVTTAFHGKFEQCKLSPLRYGLLPEELFDNWETIRFYDYYPTPPYSHLLTRPDELRVSSYECLIAALANIPSNAFGIYQIMFQPVSSDHNWHRNVEILTDFEYIAKLVGNVGVAQRYPQQAPSGDLRQMAGQIESKAHNDKPFYAAACRIAVLGEENSNEDCLKALEIINNLFQHGGRPLNYITEADYKAIVSNEQICQMFLMGLTYRPGFLLNSAELTGLVHVPPYSIFEQFDAEFNRLEPLALLSHDMSEGTPIGTCNVAGQEHSICIPEGLRLCHTHLIGKTKNGKSTLEENMIMDDIKKGHGVAVLDPHGDMVERILTLLPEEAIPRVIYFEPGNPDWVPLWNPLQRIPGQDIGRMADDLVGVLKSFVTGWGDRMEHLLRHSFFGLLHLSGGTLLDVCDILRHGSKESETIRKLIVKVVQNEVSLQFWKHDFEKYRPDEFGPPKHKLSKLLVSNTVSLMLSQPHSAFNFRRIMDDGMIFLANLSSNLGMEVRGIIGGFILATMHMTALSRSDIPREKRRPFHIYLDEAHRFVTDSLEEIIAETRKYGVSLTLANQYSRQFDVKKVDALGSVGTTIVFNVDTRDANYLSKDFQKKAKDKDFIDLGIGEAIVRCGTEVVKIKTLGPLKAPEKNFRDQIIAESRIKYCKPALEVQRLIQKRGNRADQPFTPLVPATGGTKKGGTHEELIYREF